MRRLIGRMLLGGVLAVVGCGEQAEIPTQPQDQIAAAQVQAVAGRNFVAPLRGDAEVPPVTTNAVGTAGFRVRAGGNSMEYMVLIGRLSNITQAHIHLGGPGVNGPVVAWLYPPSPPVVLIPGEFNGVLGEGIIDAARLVGPLAGQPFGALLDEMRAGNTYVNVHTSAFPGGEIRGQIVAFEPID